MKRRPEEPTCVGGENQGPIEAEVSEAKRSKKNKKKSTNVENNVRGRYGSQQEEENEDEEAEQLESLLKPGGDGDVCRALMDRYARSSAAQHRHLCATAAAMRSILCEEGLPLTPSAYFAAAITAFRDTDGTDREGAAALSAFLVVVLPLVPAESLPRSKAKDAAFVLASFLRDTSGVLPTGSLRSLVKSLGLVALRVDLDDWSAVELPLDTLLRFAVNKRPKVRRCAQACLETAFESYHNSPVIKKASKVVLCIHKKCFALVSNSTELKDADQNNTVSKPEHVKALHMLNFLNVILPYLSNKVRMKIFSDVYKLLGCHFSWTTRHILRLLEVLLEHLNVKVLADEAENIMSVLTSYVSTAEKNPIDTIISAASLLKDAFLKFRDAFPSMWMRYLPPVFTSLTGYLRSNSDTSKHVAGILKELIDFHIDQGLFKTAKGQSGNYEMDSIPEAAAVASVCNVSDKMLKKSTFPTEHMLEVISILFLKLGESSFFFMKKILIRLSRYALNVEEERPNKEHLEQCIGAAVISMGPEKLLSAVPITIDMEKMAFSNSWVMPIMRKYVIGASLEYYIDNFVPLAKSIQKACKKVKNESMLKSLQSCFHSIWDLLPAFCRYPTDLSEKIESLSLLFMAILKEEPSLHEIIASSLQMLVHSNIEDNRHRVEDPSIIFSQTFNMKMRNISYSKKAASKNMKALTSRSIELFQILKDMFFDCPERHGYIKDALGSLSFIIPSEYIRNFFLSSLKTVDQSSDLAEPESLDNHVQEKDKNDNGAETTVMKNEERRCLLMELASSFVEAADSDLTNIIFNLIRSLLVTSGACEREAYCTLSRILKEKEQYATSQFDEIMELLFTVKPPIDTISLQKRFSCFDNLLVYMLKSNGDMNTKAFLILNEIILTLKSKKESRKLAYDTLLTISSRLKSLHSCSADSDLLRLFNMVMGYLSSSSPHILSGAVSALSLLIYHDAAFCLSVPNLIPSVLLLLENKANEVIKATLGFVKVLVSSLNCNDLMKLLPDIIHGILPWSSVSKHHFRSKVGLILEILIRKCSSDAVEKHSPEKYKGFVKSIKEGRQNRKILSSDPRKNSSDSIRKGGKKRPRDEALNPSKKPPRYNSRYNSKSENKKTGKPPRYNSKSENKKTGKKSEKGFPNKGFSKVVHKGLRNQSATACHPNSHSPNKVRPRSIANNHKKRNAEKQKPSCGVDTRTRKQKQPLSDVQLRNLRQTVQ